MAATPTRDAAVAEVARPRFDLDAAWQLHPQVSVRPERFGALLYHFGTRRLAFCKNVTVAAVIQSLATEPTARAACLTAGIDGANLPAYEAALASLAASQTIIPRAFEPGAIAPPAVRP